MTTPRDLPLPSTQIIEDDGIVWIWDTGVGHVHAKYENETEKYRCGLATGESLIFEMTPDQARDLGDALLASYLYQFQWRNFIGNYPNSEEVRNVGN